MPMRPLLLISVALVVSRAAIAGTAAYDAAVAEARQRWQTSPYGPMLERILPPGFTSGMLPDSGSPGAALTVRYCVQCHNLPNPAMHQPAKWPKILERMVARMRGQGNMGRLMTDMMGGLSAPSDEQARTLLAYLQRFGQQPLDPEKYPDVLAPENEPFRLACQQCHVLPDPQRHTAAEWRRVVARMQQNMRWMNRVVGSKPDPDEPQLRVDRINAFLARHARR
ncbi:MAG TPA: hypothetical protein VEH51_08525 [Burkholderiales bacterium]|nr:hypothetical protein [Burkholderiales bacterium]